MRGIIKRRNKNQTKDTLQKIKSMSYVHPSHYFDSVEGFIRLNSQHCSIAMLNRFAKDADCPDDLVEQVVNGAIVDYIMRIVSGPDDTVTCADMNGHTVPVRIYHPTSAELIAHLTEIKFSDLSQERAGKIIDFLLNKPALSFDTDGCLYCSMRLIPRQLVAL